MALNNADGIISADGCITNHDIFKPADNSPLHYYGIRKIAFPNEAQWNNGESNRMNNFLSNIFIQIINYQHSTTYASNFHCSEILLKLD